MTVQARKWVSGQPDSHRRETRLPFIPSMAMALEVPGA